MDVVRLQNICVSYNGTPALEGINLQVATHDFKEASERNPVMPLECSAMADGSPGDVLTPKLLLMPLGAQVWQH